MATYAGEKTLTASTMDDLEAALAHLEAELRHEQDVHQAERAEITAELDRIKAELLQEKIARKSMDNTRTALTAAQGAAINRLQANNDSLKVELSSEQTARQKACDDLKNTLDSCETETTDLQEELVEADSRACDLNAANEDLKSKIVMMTEELAAAKEHYEKSRFVFEKRLSHWKDSMENLTKQAEQQNQEFDQLEKHAEEVDAKLTATKEVLVKCQSISKDHRKECEARQQAANDQSEWMAKRNERLYTINAQLEEELASKKADLETERETRREETQAFDGHKDHLSKIIGSLQEEIAQKRSDLESERENTIKESEINNEQHDLLSKNITSLQKELAQTKSDFHLERDYIKKETQTSHQANAFLVKRITSLQDEALQTKKALDNDRENNKKETGMLIERNVRLVDNNTSLKNEIAQKQKEVDAERNNSRRHEVRQNALSASLRYKGHMLDMLKTACDERQAFITKLESEKASLRKDLEQMNKEVQARAANLESEIEQMAIRNEELQARVEPIFATMTECQRQLEESQRAHLQTQAEYAYSEVMRSKAEQSDTESTLENRQFVFMVKKLSSELKATKQALEQLQANTAISVPNSPTMDPTPADDDDFSSLPDLISAPRSPTIEPMTANKDLSDLPELEPATTYKWNKGDHITSKTLDSSSDIALIVTTVESNGASVTESQEGAPATIDPEHASNANIVPVSRELRQAYSPEEDSDVEEDSEDEEASPVSEGEEEWEEVDGVEAVKEDLSTKQGGIGPGMDELD